MEAFTSVSCDFSLAAYAASFCDILDWRFWFSDSQFLSLLSNNWRDCSEDRRFILSPSMIEFNRFCSAWKPSLALENVFSESIEVLVRIDSSDWCEKLCSCSSSTIRFLEWSHSICNPAFSDFITEIWLRRTLIASLTISAVQVRNWAHHIVIVLPCLLRSNWAPWASNSRSTSDSKAPEKNHRYHMSWSTNLYLHPVRSGNLEHWVYHSLREPFSTSPRRWYSEDCVRTDRDVLGWS